MAVLLRRQDAAGEQTEDADGNRDPASRPSGGRKEIDEERQERGDRDREHRPDGAEVLRTNVGS